MTDRSQELAKMLSKALDVIETNTKQKIIDAIAPRLNMAHDDLMKREVSELRGMRDTLERLKPSFVSGSPMNPLDPKTNERQKLDSMFSDTMKKLKEGKRI